MFFNTLLINVQLSKGPRDSEKVISVYSWTGAKPFVHKKFILFQVLVTVVIDFLTPLFCVGMKFLILLSYFMFPTCTHILSFTFWNLYSFYFVRYVFNSAEKFSRP